MNKPVTHAVLLAAGRGSRLRPHTDSIPKPLLPVNGQPTLDLIFHALSAAGIKQAMLVTHYRADQINDYIKTCSPRFGIHAAAVRQPSLDGTAGALAAVKATGWLTAANPFLVSATDYLIPKRFYQALIDHHARAGCDITASLKRLQPGEGSMRSSVRFAQGTKDDWLIEEIVEKPAPGSAPSNISANLVYVLPSALLDLIDDIDLSPRGEREIQTAINRYLACHGPAAGILQPTPAEWSPTLLD